jgi:hypothetical protein
MTSFTTDIDRAKLGSPDRADALVWAMTELMIERVPYQRLIDYYRGGAGNPRQTRHPAGASAGGPAAAGSWRRQFSLRQFGS